MGSGCSTRCATRASIPRGRPALIIGAGGSARAAAASLLAAGAGPVRLLARRPEAALALREALAPVGEVELVSALPSGPLGIVVHCTPIGGLTELEALPVPADALERMDIVCDFAYRADGAPTPLIAAAAARGLAVGRRPRAARAPGCALVRALLRRAGAARGHARGGAGGAREPRLDRRARASPPARSSGSSGCRSSRSSDIAPSRPWISRAGRGCSRPRCSSPASAPRSSRPLRCVSTRFRASRPACSCAPCSSA